jgi:hypothetical protein
MGRRCDGETLRQYPNFNNNDGGSEDRAACESRCTSFSTSEGLGSWCCEFYEDSGVSTLWVCRIYDVATHTATNGENRFASSGACE